MPRHRRESCRRPSRPFVASSRTRAGKAAVKNRIASVRDAFDAKRMLGRFTAAIVAGILAKRSFERKSARIGRDKSFENNFGRGGYYEIAQLAFHQLHRR